MKKVVSRAIQRIGAPLVYSALGGVVLLAGLDLFYGLAGELYDGSSRDRFTGDTSILILAGLHILIASSSFAMAFLVARSDVRMSPAESDGPEISSGRWSGSIDNAESLWASACERILLEIEHVRSRGNLNLAIGVGVTIAAIFMLLWFARDISEIRTNEDTATDWAAVLLRISLVVFAEVFGFFFLRQYGRSQAEIERYQNELISLEMWAAALAESKAIDHSAPLEALIERLASVDRNGTRHQAAPELSAAVHSAVADALRPALARLSPKSRSSRI